MRGRCGLRSSGDRRPPVTPGQSGEGNGSAATGTRRPGAPSQRHDGHSRGSQARPAQFRASTAGADYVGLPVRLGQRRRADHMATRRGDRFRPVAAAAGPGHRGRQLAVSAGLADATSRTQRRASRWSQPRARRLVRVRVWVTGAGRRRAWARSGAWPPRAQTRKGENMSALSVSIMPREP
jgi:hypothetical protein